MFRGTQHPTGAPTACTSYIAQNRFTFHSAKDSKVEVMSTWAHISISLLTAQDHPGTPSPGWGSESQQPLPAGMCSCSNVK